MHFIFYPSLVYFAPSSHFSQITFVELIGFLDKNNIIHHPRWALYVRISYLINHALGFKISNILYSMCYIPFKNVCLLIK